MMSNLCNMNQVSGRGLLDKNALNQHSKTAKKKCCFINSLTADCQCFTCCNKTDERHKIKRRKTRKERSLIRGCCREGRHQSSKDVPHFHNCCHSHYSLSKRDARFSSFIPVVHEPSIITDSRLIGHHGLFNHEVKSIDIERLLSGQEKQEKSGDQVQEKKHDFSCKPSTSGSLPPPFSKNVLMDAKTNEVVSFEKNADDATNAHDDMEIITGSGITLLQQPQQELVPSSGSCKSICSSKYSSLDVAMYKSKKTNSESEKVRESQSQTSGRVIEKSLKKKTHMTFSPHGDAINNQKPPAQQTQAHGLSPGLIQLSSSTLTESLDVQQRRQNPSCVSKSVSTVAARLCNSMHFPFIKRRNLVTESREVLLRALLERHGPQLQENLFKLQQCHSLGSGPKKEVQREKPTMIDEDVLFPTDASAFQAGTAIQPCFENERSDSLKRTGSGRFTWSSQQPHKILERTAEWSTSPVASSASLLEGVVRPGCTPRFFMDSWPSRASASDHLFSPSATSCWRGTASTSQHRDDSFNRLKTNDSFLSDLFKNILRNSSAVGESCGPHYTGSRIKPLFPYSAQLPDERSEQTHFTQEPGQFVSDRHSYAPSLSAQVHPTNMRNQFIHRSPCPPPRSLQTDMAYYPPSHMLEKDPAPTCPRLSPEHWCFPPMRLY